VSGEQRYTAIPKGFAAPTDTRWHSIRDRRIGLTRKSWMVGPSPTMTLGIAQIRDRRIWLDAQVVDGRAAPNHDTGDRAVSATAASGLTRKSWMVGPRPTMTLGSLRSATALARLTMALGE
jgi:hypothetical protein